MKRVVNWYTGVNLVLRIVVGLLIGVVLALLIAPAMKSASGTYAGILGFLSSFVSLFGTIFVGALKGIAPILVFLLVSSALALAKIGSGRIMKSVIVLYIVGTLSAALAATVVSYFFPVQMVFGSDVDLSSYSAPSGLDEVINTLFANIVSNPVAALAGGNYLCIIFWSVLLGLSLRIFASDAVKSGLKVFADALTEIVRWIIQIAPFGIMGLVFTAVSETGLSIFVDYGKLILVLVAAMIFMFLVVNPLIVFIATRKNPYPLVLTCIAESGVTAFFTRSSAANIPVNMSLCEKIGLDRDLYSISIPLGATINMEGAAITITVMTLATCNTLGVSVDFATALLLSVVAALGACGASGVAGGSLLLIPMACALFGISPDIAMDVVAVGFIIGVIQDSMETALNSSTDVVFTATAEYRDKKKRGETVKSFLHQGSVRVKNSDEEADGNGEKPASGGSFVSGEEADVIAKKPVSDE